MIGAYVKQRRQELGLSQKALAKIVKVSTTYLSEIECDKRTPSLQMILTLSESLDITVDHFLQDTTEQGWRYKLSMYTKRIGDLPEEDYQLVMQVITTMLQFYNRG